MNCPLSAKELEDINSTNNRISARVSLLRSEEDKSVPPILNLESTKTVSGSAAYPLFGRLRRDFDTESLMGEYKPPNIVLPV
eukprot:SAG31_NODE_19765_length_592_cov_0.904665_1_plen_81_part_10